VPSFPSWLQKLLADYPALVTGALGGAVTLLAKFGFHVTTDQLVVWVMMAYSILAVVVHGGMASVRKHR